MTAFLYQRSLIMVALRLLVAVSCAKEKNRQHRTCRGDREFAQFGHRYRTHRFYWSGPDTRATAEINRDASTTTVPLGITKVLSLG